MALSPHDISDGDEAAGVQRPAEERHMLSRIVSRTEPTILITREGRQPTKRTLYISN